MRLPTVPVLLLTLALTQVANSAPQIVLPQPMLGFVADDGTYKLMGADPLKARDVFRGVEYQISYSANGSMLAYLGADNMIYLGNPLAGKPQSIAHGDGGRGAWALSPDGRKLAYVAGDGVRVWEAGNSQVVPGVKHALGLAWSPDSKRLALGCMANASDETRDGGVWVWNGSGKAKPIAPPAGGANGSSGMVQWSPDGKWLAWARGYGDGWTGDLARSDGTGLKRNCIGAGPVKWLPDSKALVVEIHIEAGAFTTGIYRMAQRKLFRLGEKYEESASCLSPDGKQLLLFPRTGKNRMYDTATLTSKAWGPEMRVTEAAWSPAGKVALHVTNPDDAWGSLWLCNADGTGATNTGHKLSIVAGLRWLGPRFDISGVGALEIGTEGAIAAEKG